MYSRAIFKQKENIWALAPVEVDLCECGCGRMIPKEKMVIDVKDDAVLAEKMNGTYDLKEIRPNASLVYEKKE